MKRELITASRMTLTTLLLTGLIYPLVVTSLAQALFPRQANGSLILDEARVVGSELIAQSFKSPAYFQPRPSAAGAEGYDASASSGSNLGPTSQKLRDRVVADIARLKNENPHAPGPVPIELITTSASGLDPHLSPAAARWQAPRIAAARQVPVERIQSFITTHTEGRTGSLLGEPRVNVLLMNLDLDRQKKVARR